MVVDFLAERYEKYCAPFQVKGLACEDEGCTHTHARAFCSMDKGGKEAQCEHVERNKNQMMFVPGTRVADKFQHLIKNGKRD